MCELAKLHALGYDGLTIGIETGDDEALQFMNKGYTSSDILTQCRRLDAAGIHYSFFYLVSISGAGRGELGAKLTADICNQLRERTADDSAPQAAVRGIDRRWKRPLQQRW